MTGFVERAIGALTRADGWENVILGLGGAKDPSVYTSFVARTQLTEPVLEALYVQDHFAARIVEALPREAMRPGWSLSLPGDPADTADVRDRFATREDELGVAAEMAQGACWGRLFGGALTWIGADDGRPPYLPLREDVIESVRWLHTFDRRDVVVHGYYSDPAHPRFREPEVYRVRPQVAAGATGPAAIEPGGALVHASRAVVWGGQPTTEARRIELAGWDDSVLERCWDALRQTGEDYGAKSLLLGRIAQAIYKIKNLYALIAGKQMDVLTARMGMLEASRSRARAILLDTEEDFINVTQPVAGVDSLIDRGVLRLAAAAQMPVSVLLGQSAGVLKDAGQGELELWAAQVEAWRTLELRRRHERIARLMLLAKDGPTNGAEPDKWEIKYRALREPTAKERAEVRKLQMETDALGVDKGFFPPEVVALQRFSPSAGGDFVLDEEELRANLDRRKQLANQPPKDNAELGTVGARAESAMSIVTKVATKQIPRESGRTLLIELFRLTPEVAESILGPEDFEPAAAETANKPGPLPSPRKGEGAGAPQGLPGVNDGGDDELEREVPAEAMR